MALTKDVDKLFMLIPVLYCDFLLGRCKCKVYDMTLENISLSWQVRNLKSAWEMHKSESGDLGAV